MIDNQSDQSQSELPGMTATVDVRHISEEHQKNHVKMTKQSKVFSDTEQAGDIQQTPGHLQGRHQFRCSSLLGGWSPSLLQQTSASLAMPLLALIILLAILLVTQIQVSVATSALKNKAELSYTIGSLMHETQLERGQGSLFLSANGTRSPDALISQMQLTDLQLTQLLRYSAEHIHDEPRLADPVFQRCLTLLVVDLTTIRAKVLSRNTTGVTVVNFFSDLNAQLVSVVLALAAESVGTGVSSSLRNLVISYASFVAAKELVGVQRASGNVAINSGGFLSSTHFNQFLTAAIAMNVHMDFVRLYSESMPYEYYQRLARDSSFILSDSMKSVLLTNNATAIQTLIAVDWFGNITQRINLLKLAEQGFADRLFVQAGMELRQSSSTTAGYICLISVLVFVNLVTLFALIRSIRRHQRDLVKAVDQVSRLSNSTNHSNPQAQQRFSQQRLSQQRMSSKRNLKEEIRTSIQGLKIESE